MTDSAKRLAEAERKVLDDISIILREAEKHGTLHLLPKVAIYFNEQELRAIVSALTDNFALAATQCDKPYAHEHGDKRCEYQDEMARLLSIVERQRKALENAVLELDMIGRHFPNCNPESCDCGLTAGINRARAALGETE